MERAAPTERLLHLAAEGDGVIRIGCFPYPRDIAESALAVHSLNQARLVFDEAAPGESAANLCAE
jgi:hypothetical protein